MHQDSPPSYALATEDAPAPYKPDTKQPLVLELPNPRPYVIAGPSYTTPGPSGTNPMVYHYVNPLTQEHVASLLPPDHPAMICLQSGEHIKHTKFGVLGIIAAVLWFPLGIGLCLLDRKVTCQRCGSSLD